MVTRVEYRQITQKFHQFTDLWRSLNSTLNVIIHVIMNLGLISVHLSNLYHN